jgi:hypothetical protein
MSVRFWEAPMFVRMVGMGRYRNGCSGWISAGPLAGRKCSEADIAYERGVPGGRYANLCNVVGFRKVDDVVETE